MRDWAEGACNEKAGFLFSHRCDRVPSDVCSRCDKPICEEHAHQEETGMICTSCKKKRFSRRAVRGGGQNRGCDDYDAPYFYGPMYGFGGYQDRHDFTEADAESLTHQDDGDFESDMMES